MSRLSLRLRLFFQRFWPRTPLKRLAYALALAVAVLAGAVLGWAVSPLAIAFVVLLRWADLRWRAARRPRISTAGRYFFEGDWPR